MKYKDCLKRLKNKMVPGEEICFSFQYEKENYAVRIIYQKDRTGNFKNTYAILRNLDAAPDFQVKVKVSWDGNDKLDLMFASRLAVLRALTKMGDIIARRIQIVLKRLGKRQQGMLSKMSYLLEKQFGGDF